MQINNTQTAIPLFRSRVNHHDGRTSDRRFVQQNAAPPVVKCENFDPCTSRMQTNVGPVEIIVDPVICHSNWVIDLCCN